MGDSAKILGNRMAQLRQQNGLSMEDLATKVGVNRSTIFKWEHGGIKIENASNKHVHALAKALNTSIAYLKGETDDSSPEMDEDRLLRIGQAYLQKVLMQYNEQTQNALDILAFQLGYNIDYDSEGNVTLHHGDKHVPITQKDVEELSTQLRSYAAFLLKQLEDKKA